MQKNNLKHFLVNTAISFLLLTSFAFGVDKSSQEEEKLKTPTKPTQMQIEWTPGEKIVQQQKDVLTRHRFVAVFGEEAIKDLEKDVQWSVFSNPNLPFDDASKRNSLRVIKSFVKNSKERNDKIFQDLYGEILKIDDAYKDIHQDRLKNITKYYFQNILQPSKIEFKPKLSGDQLGIKTIIMPKDSKPIIYYVKTHAAGLQSANSSAAKLLDPKELLVYKILEGFKVGCESHFFGRDLNNFYIATQDAGVSFLTYESIKKHPEKLQQVRGNLPNFISKNEAPDQAAQNFIEGIVCLDLLSRILRLTDLQTNSGNFGFVEQGGIYKIKAIDFRVRDDDNLKINNDHFGGFLEGNGSVKYSQSDELIYYIVKQRPEKERVLTAQKVFNHLFVNFQEVIKKSAVQVGQAIRENIYEKKQQDLSLHEEILKQMEEYANIVGNNFKFFEDKLKTYLQSLVPISDKKL